MTTLWERHPNIRGNSVEIILVRAFDSGLRFMAISNNSLLGLRVQIAIEEDGTPNPPQLPSSTVLRSLTGTDQVTYYVVHLEKPVTCLRAETGQQWVLDDLIIAPSFKGEFLEKIRKSKDSFPLAIANTLFPLEPDDPMLDFSKVSYFALGTIRRSKDT